jgi:hypothetical protein
VAAGGVEITRPETFLLKKLRCCAISANLQYGEVLRMLIGFDFYDRRWKGFDSTFRPAARTLGAERQRHG